MVCIIAKIGVFLLFDDSNDKFIEKANIFSNKSKIIFKSIRAKMYICKMLKKNFYILFL